jgi:hypothetical protein
MTRWNDQFQSHAFWASWIALKTVLADEELITSEDEAAHKEVARLNKVTAYIDAVLEQVDPELMPMAQLDAFNQHVSKTKGARLNFFWINEQPTH